MSLLANIFGAWAGRVGVAVVPVRSRVNVQHGGGPAGARKRVLAGCAAGERDRVPDRSHLHGDQVVELVAAVRGSVREAAPAVFPVFRSRLTAAVLARTYIGEGEYSIAELARAAGTDTGTMAREIKRLETAGVVGVRVVGRAGGDPFLAELRSRPLVPLPGIPGPDDLAVSR